MPTITSGLMRGARTVTYRVGRRGFVLLFFALVDLVYAYVLARPNIEAASATYAFLNSIMPLWTWALIWGSVGLCCLVSAFLPRPHDKLAFYAAVTAKVFWASVIFVGWHAGVLERGYLSAAIWYFFAAMAFVHSDWKENWDR